MAAQSRSIPLSAWTAVFERLAPSKLAFEWDRVGLQVGDPARPVRRVAVALEATQETVRAAARMKAALLVVHHPLIWQPLAAVIETSLTGRVVRQCIERHLAVYAAHTNWDLSSHSMTRHIGELLSLKDLAPLHPKPHPAGYKLAVFVPEGDLVVVRRAMAAAGAGSIGDYTECSFSTPGTGTFFGTEGAAPALGQAGRLEAVEERRLEMALPRERLAAVLTAMTQSHPYEEVAYDVYPTEAFCDEEHLLWLGQLHRPLRAQGLANRVRRTLACGRVRLIGDPQRAVKRVALCSGSGKGLLRTVAGLDVDAFLTGDIDYHSAREAEARRVVVLDAGHFHTEKFFPTLVVRALRSQAELKGLYLRALSGERDPFQ